MKKLLLTIILSALVLPVMADTSKDLEKILANTELSQQISEVLKNLKEQKVAEKSYFYYEKAEQALDILIQENESLKPLIEKVKYSHGNLIIFLARSEYKDEALFRQTCKDLFFQLDALALDILEIAKIDKDLAKTIEKIVNHQYFFNAIILEVNISAMITLTKKYYNPPFYDNMAIAESSLIKDSSKTGYDKKWEDFIDKFLAKNK